MYDKNQILGTNRDGSMPAKPRKVHDVTEPLSHGPTIYDNDTHCLDKSIARNGAPKHLSPGGVAIHSGQHSRDRDGNLIAGQTTTNLVNAPDASGARPLDPTIPGKKLTPVSIKPGMRSRNIESGIAPAGGEPGQMHAVHAKLHGAINQAHLDQGERVLGEAVQSGSTNYHPANLRRR
jgi:hypothetical protein